MNHDTPEGSSSRRGASWSIAQLGDTLERIVVVGLLCALSGSFERLRYRLLTPRVMDRLTWSLLVGALLFLLTHWKPARAALKTLWPNALLIALAFLSALWSISPTTTIETARTLLAQSLFALCLVVRFSPTQQLDLLRRALLLVALYTAAAVASGDPHATSEHAIQGWFTSKNHLGRGMSLALVVCSVHALDAKQRWVAAAIGTVCGAALLASDSRSAMIVTAASLGLVLLLVRMPRPSNLTWRRMGLAAAGITAAVALIWESAEGLLGWMGRDVTLSARTSVWREVIARSAERRWLGYGFGTFWKVRNGPAQEVAANLHFFPWHAHNGFLDLGLDLGVIGVACFVAVLVFYGRRAARLAIGSRHFSDLWPAAYLGYFVLSNLTESELVRYDSLYWVLYLTVTAQLGAGKRSAGSGSSQATASSS